MIHKTTYRLTAEQVERVRQLSAETRVPQSVIVREVVDAGLDAWGAMHAERTRRRRAVTRRWCTDPEGEQ